MNPDNAKCCTSAPAPIEPLNDIAQNIIEMLDEVSNIAQGVRERLFDGNAPNRQTTKPEPTSLFDKLLCVRSLANEIGSTLKLVRDRL